jgi:hypothetical protein
MDMDKSLDKDRLRKVTDGMIEAITSPQFVEAMRTMKSTPPEKRLEAGAKLLSPDVLRSKGVPLPAGMRITSRYFETGKPTIEVSDPDQPGGKPIVSSTPPSSASGPVTLGACACGGAGTVCGGAGN